MYPLRELLERGADVTLFFYNPNIQPTVEWKRRFDNARRVAAHYELPMIVDDLNDSAEWRVREHDGDERCRYCYEMRFEHLVREAAAKGIDAVSSTLLVSPYQKRDMILDAGSKLAADAGLSFIPFDWREGFREGQNMAREIGLYRQKYCGCVVSLESSTFFNKIAREHEQLALAECLNCFSYFEG
jgi:predicted adenine nucleotide alpha hydrolase (AANH) superfamily ATPase